MTSKIFITGDRMMTAVYPGQVMIEMLRARNEGKQIMTGVNTGGVEELVRMIGEQSGVDIQVIEQTYITTVPADAPLGQRVDWDARNLYLKEDLEIEVLSIHVDHHTCRESMSALKVLPEERVRLLSTVDLLS